MAFRYLASLIEARALQPVPLTEATDAKLTQSIDDAEDLTDAYLDEHGVTTPITSTAINNMLKIAVAVMTAADLYCGHGQSSLCKEWTDKAWAKLDEYMAKTDLGITAPMSAPGLANYQEEFIDDWAEVNDTLENMDE